MAITSSLSSALLSSTTTGITIPSSYGWTLFSALAIVTQYLLTSFPVGIKRKKYFTKQYMKENYPEYADHVLGYPDIGHGKFSEKLTLAQWYDFNLAQRTHYNFLEHLPVVLTALLTSGLYYPRYAPLAGMTYFAGRLLFTIGYLTGGPKKRTFGIPLMAPALLSLAATAFHSAWHIGGGANGLQQLFKF